MKLRNINAIITGGTQGFGRCIVEAFVKNGANVLFCARTSDHLERTLRDLQPGLISGQQLHAQQCDIGQPEDIAKLFRFAAQLGQVHVVVNNAGVYGPIGPSEEVNFAEWVSALQINLSGTFLMCQNAVKAMKPQRCGKIINISGGGATNPMPRFASYAATKAAVVRLTETLAEEFRDDGIQVNAVAPGALRTRLTDQVIAAGPQRAGEAFFAKNKKWAEEGAVDPRLGAELCVYLASDASAGITGKLISAQWDPWADFERFRAELSGDLYTLRRIVPSDRGKDFSSLPQENAR